MLAHTYIDIDIRTIQLEKLSFWTAFEPYDCWMLLISYMGIVKKQEKITIQWMSWITEAPAMSHRSQWRSDWITNHWNESTTGEKRFPFFLYFSVAVLRMVKIWACMKWVTYWNRVNIRNLYTFIWYIIFKTKRALTYLRTSMCMCAWRNNRAENLFWL